MVEKKLVKGPVKPVKLKVETPQLMKVYILKRHFNLRNLT